MTEGLARWSGYLFIGLLLPIIGLHVYWALGGRWGLQTAIGVGNPLPAPALIWLAVAAFIAAALTVLGRLGLWGACLPWWIFTWGAWAVCVAFACGALLNARTGRFWELVLFAPIASLLAILAGLVAAWASPRF